MKHVDRVGKTTLNVDAVQESDSLMKGYSRIAHASKSGLGGGERG